MDQSIIEKINNNCPYNQGIFVEPYGCDGIREPVVYMRWTTGGVTGGSCWGTESYNREADKKPDFKALEETLRELKPDISFLDYRKVSELIISTDEFEREYYGNTREWGIEYVVLSELEELLTNL